MSDSAGESITEPCTRPGRHGLEMAEAFEQEAKEDQGGQGEGTATEAERGSREGKTCEKITQKKWWRDWAG